MGTYNRYSSNKIYFIAYDYTAEGGKARITRATAARGDGRILEWAGVDVLEQIIQDLTNRGATLVYCWDMAEFGAYLEYYALSHGLPHYDEADRQKGRKGVAEQCYNILYTGNFGILNARLTLKRTALTHDFRGGKVGGLHTVEYRGLSPLFGGGDFGQVVKDFKAAGDTPAEQGINLAYTFFNTFEKLTGEKYLQRGVLSRIYTIGASAVREYLHIKYGKGKGLAAYHREFYAAERMEDYLRERKLLLGGLCAFPAELKGKLFEETPLNKYDVNGLHPAKANEVGALGYPEKTTFEDFEKNASTGEYAYILIFDYALLFRREGAPDLFYNPFTHIGGAVIEIDNEWACFGELFRALQLFYQFEDFNIKAVLRCKRKPDPAIIEFNNKYARLKVEAKQAGNTSIYMFAKLHLNALIGKWAQASKFREVLAAYNRDDDVVIHAAGKLVNRWEKKHFDYIRGAYVYVMSRVQVMQDIYDLTADTDNPRAHHFYTDTDSIITDLEMTADRLSATELGKYKLEKVYTAFGVIALKTYYGITSDGKEELIAAGMRKGSILAQVRDKYGGDLTPAQTWTALTSGEEFTLTAHMTISGGSIFHDYPVKLGKIDINKML